MILRWSIWGSHKEKSLEMLRYSILTFRKQCGTSHRYIIFTDTPKEITGIFGDIAEVLDFNCTNNEYDINSIATWKKWSPDARLDVTETEVYVDTDVFLLKYPKELDTFLANPKKKFAIMDEFKGQPWQHGAMHKKGVKEAPYVNAGFFVQKAGYSISDDLLQEKEWWQQNISKGDRTHHDEQGCLALALAKYKLNDELYIFPNNKYMLIGPNENSDIQSLDTVTMFHAVYPKHPAFYRFKDVLDEILYE
jgi:hypothetical protein